MSQGPIITKGLPVNSGDNGPVPIRREIRELERNHPDVWNLYLLGLDAFQKLDENDPLSYYQIAGIHGRPYKAWPNDAGSEKPVGFGGYCTHNSILFPTWHRPYLALFEQTLSTLVTSIATSFPSPADRSRYQAAARDFRMPYWDWAAPLRSGDSVLPASLRKETVQVVTPSSAGKTIPMENPLYSFKFHPLNPVPGDFPLKNAGRGPFTPNLFATYTSSVRYPLRNTSTSQNAQAEAAFEQQVRNLRELVFYLVSSYDRYGPFSNNQWNQGQPGIYGSLEGVHDTVHGVAGGGGHMSVVPYAAFDPLFWLHHCNVDRLFALWQAIHPDGRDSFVTAQPTESGTFTTTVGSTETKTSPLTPFYNAADSFWTSDGVRSTLTLGYAYPETQSWNFASPKELQSSVADAVNRLYGGSSVASIVGASANGGVNTLVQAKTAGTARGLPQMKMAVKAPAKPDQETARGINNSNGNENANGNPFIVTPTITNRDISAQAPMADKASNGDGQQSEQEAKMEKASNEEHATNEKETNGKSTTRDPQPTNKPTANPLGSDNKYLEWLTNIRAQKHSLGGTFHVPIFLGPFPTDPTGWSTATNLVGTFTVLGDSPDTGCAKCQRDREAHLSVTGQIPLTMALAERVASGELAGLGVESVVPYLRENLHWRVVTMDGVEVPRGQVPDLKVSVVSNEVSVPVEPGMLPVYAEEVRVHPEVTTAADGSGRGEGTGLVDVGET